MPVGVLYASVDLTRSGHGLIARLGSWSQTKTATPSPRERWEAFDAQRATPQTCSSVANRYRRHTTPLGQSRPDDRASPFASDRNSI